MDTSTRRRTAELKHGRLVCLGCFIPVPFLFTVHLSPPLGLKFAGIPYGSCVLSPLSLFFFFVFLFCM